ncbi:hypothetical protein AG0111_0g4505 [Alternaria gaisen]|uniref:Uncharacterized protein n=1 Tax=Alternaria gaisen TaxID=167740 RepID=A0ACB6FUL3_9PLEO|nr:hypothetical protein AG0111_0g4505 [Alternaria gaisen]
MEHRFASTLLGFFAFFILLASIKPAGAADWTQSYCSSLNTGSDDQVYNWPWQSNGNCTNHCKEEGTYAFAVLQYTDCWCSNYAPGETANMNDCEVDCPGFPDEKCGNKDKDLFMYIEMDGQVSGTIGGSQPTSSADAPSSTQEAPKTSAKPSTTQSSESDDTTTSAEEPVTMPTVVTESGRVITRTLVVTPTATAAPADTGSSDSDKSSTNVGAIAGGVAGGVIALLAIAGGIIFVLWRKRRQQVQQQDGHESGSAGISRNVSTMSRAGLLGGRSEKSPTQLVTNFGSQRSRHDDESITPVTPSTRRLSQPILVDSRLNPTAVLTFHGANASRESLGSIDDSRDYGRQLNVRNPDPN